MNKRVLLAAALVAGVLSVVAPGTASAASSASLGPVSCADGQGTVTLTLTADSARDTGFLYTVKGDVFSDQFLEDQVVVPAGESTTIPVGDLEDGEYRVTASSEEPDDDFHEVLDQTIVVACDPAPEGPYANAQAVIGQSCGTEVTVHAANRPIGGNIEDLQPASFVFTLTRGDADTTLAEFTLPQEADDPYTRSVTVDLAEFGVENPYDDTDSDDTDSDDGAGVDPEEPGDGGDAEPRSSEDDEALVLSVTADGTELDSERFYFCVVVENSAGGEGGPAVVNTGA